MNISLQKCNSQPQRAISEDYSHRLYLKHIKMNFRSPKVDTIHANLKKQLPERFSSSRLSKDTNNEGFK